MYPHSAGQGQMPSHWQPPAAQQQPTNAAYPPPPPSHMNTTLPPPPQEPRPDMAAHQHPQYQQQYRLPGPNEWTRAPPPQDPYRQQGPPPPPQYVQQHHQPPAPRQRTAIACRYCRRRKIRCSGFEATEDGRCSNCLRFNQDCIFTPVSAQTQAFVPAHTVWRGVGAPPPLYGAYGQPLPPANHAEAYAQPPRQGPPPPQQHYLPSPTAATPSAPYSSAPPASQPYYTAQPPRQPSPQSAYRYDPSRTSSSPHSQAPTTPGSASAPYYPPQQNGALQPNPPRTDGRTPPPPTSQPASRPGMRINDLVSDNGNGRSSTDSDMLNMLNRRPM
ncbi:hypothetical protein M3J09_004258 [Ascochyta lentis]